MKYKEGMKVMCEIGSTKITDAKLHYEDDWGIWYICQNLKNGTECKNKLGYKYSWAIDADVTNLQLAKPELDWAEIDKAMDWWVAGFRYNEVLLGDSLNINYIDDEMEVFIRYLERVEQELKEAQCQK